MFALGKQTVQAQEGYYVYSKIDARNEVFSGTNFQLGNVR